MFSSNCQKNFQLTKEYIKYKFLAASDDLIKGFVCLKITYSIVGRLGKAYSVLFDKLV